MSIKQENSKDITRDPELPVSKEEYHSLDLATSLPAKPLNLEERKAQIDSLWDKWSEVQSNPALLALAERKASNLLNLEPEDLLKENAYPERSRISDLKFETWTVKLDEKFVRDGYIYLLRGDFPGQDTDGFYSRTYGYGKRSVEQLQKELLSSSDVGYFLTGDDRYLNSVAPSSTSTAEVLALFQSQVGGSSFISTTTNIPCAQAGTGNQPSANDKATYEVYIMKVPIDFVINSNTGNHFGLEENEYLVADFVDKNEIIAKFSRNEPEAIYEYMRNLLGVSRADLGL